MKKAAFLLLIFSLLLSGCGEKGISVENIQKQYEQVAAAHMEAEVTAHLAEENSVFSLSCDYVSGGKTVITILTPEELAGVTATVDGESLTVSYDDMILPAGTLDGVCPANALPYLLKAIADGYVTEYGEETMDGVACCRILFREEDRYCTAWLDKESLIPRFAEVAGEDGVVALSVKMLTFSCTLTEE